MKNQNLLWCGIDVSKKSFDVALVTDQQISEFKRIPVHQFRCNESGVDEFVCWLDNYCQEHHILAGSVRAVMESTGSYSLKLYVLIVARREALVPAIVNPAYSSNFQKSLGLRSKTDAIDARALGMFGRERRPTPFYPPSKAQQELRDLFRLRKSMVSQRVASENRLNETSSQAAQEVLIKHIQGMKKSIKDLEKKMASLINKEPSLRCDYTILRSIPGVGFLTACAVLAEIGDLRRFQCSRQLSSFVGVSPRIKESGTSVRGRSRISRAGNAMIRRCLYMAALKAIQDKTSTFGKVYQRLLKKGKAKKAAILAVMRKMLVTMRAMVIASELYFTAPVENHG